ncbi:efflux RND transporter periplasmic adaptor subunit, partial [Pseudomonas sp.]|uniref:efflux RND transporter periplasmic adaptor subunit n=1 Tax=Pseudomonas sp. TaxID=306 RepID=UPI004053CE7A
MNKTLIAILVAGLATATASHAQVSGESEHAQEKGTSAAAHGEQDEHGDHDEEDHDEHEEHDAHKPNAEHGHEEHGDDEAHSDHDGEAGEHGGHKEAASPSLNPGQMALANIQVGVLTARPVDYQLYAPGEILSNGYSSYRVSPRVASVVLRRHVALGDHVKKDQPLVTLFSESVAQAQADYRKAWPEWQRVQELGRKIVGEQRYISAKANLEAAQATLLAYGLSTSHLESLTSQQ